MFHSGYVVEKREKCKEKKGKNSPHVKGGEINKQKNLCGQILNAGELIYR